MLPVMNQEWDIKPRGKACAACQTVFAEGHVYHARLLVDAQGYVRADFCEPCWSQRIEGEPYFSAWQGVFRLPPQDPPKTPLRQETAETLLRQCMAADDPTRKNVIYILAVMLERKRVLVEREVRPRADGARIVVYEHRKTGESFIILDPQLKLNALAEVQNEVIALLADPAIDAVEPEPVVASSRAIATIA